MSNLNAFLHPVKVENKKIVVSDRFKNEDGTSAEWEIRALTENENSRIEKSYTTRNKKTGVEQFDRNTYAHALVVAAVVSPDLKSAELQKAFEVLGEIDLIKAMLTIGEFATLSEAVTDLSGLDKNDINEQIDEAKNS